MAELNITPDDLQNALTTRIGQLEAENVALRLLLKQAGEIIDQLTDPTHGQVQNPVVE